MDFKLFRQKGFLKEIKQKIKKTEALGDGLAKSFFNEDGECQIDVVLTKGNLYNDFSSNRQKRLNPDIYQYIDNNAYYIPLMYKICLNFILEDDLQSEKEFINREIDNHYSLLTYDKKDDIKRTSARMYILFAFGVITLLAYFFLEGFQKGNVLFVEILSIAGSFGIWGGLDAFLERSSQKKDLWNYAQLGLATKKFTLLKDEKIDKSKKLVKNDKTKSQPD